MTKSEIEGIAKGIVPFLLEFRKDMESRLCYRGTYRKDAKYRRGNFVTHSGSLWHCEQDNPSTKPGTSSDWKLAVKRGTFSDV